MITRGPRIQIVRPLNRARRWWVRLRAANGRIVFTSETYSTKRAALRAAGILREIAVMPPLPIVDLS